MERTGGLGGPSRADCFARLSAVDRAFFLFALDVDLASFERLSGSESGVFEKSKSCGKSEQNCGKRLLFFAACARARNVLRGRIYSGMEVENCGMAPGEIGW